MKALLTRGTGAASRLIQGRLQERWSHGVGLVPGQPLDIIDSTLGHYGVRQRLLSKALRDVSAVLELDVPLPNEAAGLGFARMCVKEKVPYDIEALWGFTVGSRHWHKPTAYYCFEFLAAWWRAGGITAFDHQRMVTADDLIMIALEHGTVTERFLTIDGISCLSCAQ